MDALIVRDADLEDLAAVAALRWQWVLANGCDPVVDGQTFITAFQNWALAHTATHWCAVAIRTDQVVGMAWLALTDRVPSPRSLERTTADVQCVYVVPAERNRGVAQRLMDAVVAQGHRWGVERITVHSSEQAVPLYRRAGFSSHDRLLDLQVQPRMAAEPLEQVELRRGRAPER